MDTSDFKRIALKEARRTEEQEPFEKDGDEVLFQDGGDVGGAYAVDKYTVVSRDTGVYAQVSLTEDHCPSSREVLMLIKNVNDPLADGIDHQIYESGYEIDRESDRHSREDWIDFGRLLLKLRRIPQKDRSPIGRPRQKRR